MSTSSRPSSKRIDSRCSIEGLEPRVLLSLVVAEVVQRPSYNTGTGFFVSGGRVYDANGDPFTIRGFNHTFWWGDNAKNLAAIDEFPKTKANAIRAVFGTGFGISQTPAQRRDITERIIDAGIVPIVEDHMATNTVGISTINAVVDRWLEPDNVAWLKQYESSIILNIANEWGPDSTVWRDLYISNIHRLRTAGINAMLMVDAGGYSGQNIHSIKTWAREILDADPQHNVAFSIHMYGFWRTEGATDVGTWSPSIGAPWDIDTEMTAAQNLGVPLIAGEFSWDGSSLVWYDTERALEVFTNLNMGWLAWSWNQNSDPLLDMTATNKGYQYNSDADLSDFGNVVVNDPVVGLKATAQPASIFAPVTISGTVFDDLMPNGYRDVDESGSANRTVFLDIDDNGALDAGESSRTTADDGSFAFSELAPATYRLRIVTPTGSHVTTPARNITLRAGQDATGIEIGLAADDTPAPTTGLIAGALFNDSNNSGVRDFGEQGMAQQTLFLDVDDDNQRDSGETTTVTDARGAFLFGSLAGGTYHVRAVVPSGWVNSTPPIDITLSTGASAPETNLGLTIPRLNSIGGYYFNDINKDGQRITDGSEPGFESSQIFIDANNNGTPDSGEMSVLTGPDGFFLFNNLAPGTYRIRRVLTNGWQFSTAPVNATVAGGQDIEVLVGVYGVPGSISGTHYNDLNGNGTRDSGESGIGGAQLYLDIDNDSVLDATEQRVITAADGSFQFSNAPPTKYRVRVILPTGYTANVPAPTLSPGQTITGISVGLARLPNLSGTYFNDADADGTRDSGEAGIGGAEIFLDANNNGRYDSGETRATTAADGSFTFSSLQPGTHSVRRTAPAGFYISTSPANVTLVLAQDRTGVLIGQARLPTLSGTQFNDANANGVRDNGEAGVAGAEVFLDSNGNGAADVGELRATTGANGSFTFTGVAFGTYDVASIAPTHYYISTAVPHVTIVAGPDVSGVLIGVAPRVGSISGVYFSDLNANGLRDTDETGVGNAEVFIDSNNNTLPDTGEPRSATATDGSFTFGSLLPGTYRIRAARAGYYISTPLADPTIGAEEDLSGVLVGVAQIPVGSISGIYFNDANANGVRDTGEAGVGGRELFLDTNGNGTPDTGETRATSAGDGSFTFSELVAGDYKVRHVAPTGYYVSTPSVNVTLAPWQNVNGILVGVAVIPANGSLRGYAFNDSNADGIQNGTESRASGKTVFLDTNGNGALDTAEARVVTDGSGNWSFTALPTGTYHVRRVFPTGYTYSTPLIDVPLANGQNITNLTIGSRTITTPVATASLAGYAFIDTNADGLQNGAETRLVGSTVFLDANSNGRLDTGEKSVVTDSTGSWRFGSLVAGTYHVRSVFPSGYTYSTPLIDKTLATGAAVTNLVIGRKTAGIVTGSVKGYAFNDSNKNGVQDGSESRASGKTVFLDVNANNKLDSGEKNVVTDSQGNWSFLNLAAGTYHVRRVFPSGYTYSTKLIDLALATGQTITGLAIGSKQI